MRELSKYMGIFALFCSLAMCLIVNAKADSLIDQSNCKFINPDVLLKRLKPKYEYFKDDNYLTMLDYYWETSEKDRKHLIDCEVRTIKTNNFLRQSKKMQEYLLDSYNNTHWGADIEDAEYSNDKFSLASICQKHACSDNIHSNIFDKEGNLIGMVIYTYPVEDSSTSPFAQEMSDRLKEKKMPHFPLEVWTFIRKGKNTPDMKAFLKEVFSRIEKANKASIIAVHDLSD